MQSCDLQHVRVCGLCCILSNILTSINTDSNYVHMYAKYNITLYWNVQMIMGVKTARYLYINRPYK
jgi:hypothetical protein